MIWSIVTRLPSLTWSSVRIGDVVSPLASKPILPIGESKFDVAATFLSTSARVGILPPSSLIAFSIAAISIFAAV